MIVSTRVVCRFDKSLASQILKIQFRRGIKNLCLLYYVVKISLRTNPWESLNLFAPILNILNKPSSTMQDSSIDRHSLPLHDCPARFSSLKDLHHQCQPPSLRDGLARCPSCSTCGPGTRRPLLPTQRSSKRRTRPC